MKKIFGFSRPLKWFLTALVLLLLVIGAFSDWIVDWMWLKNMGYVQVFWTIKGTQFFLLVVSFIISALYLVPNYLYFAKELRKADLSQTPLENLRMNLIDRRNFRRIKWLFTIIALGLSLLFAFSFFAHWDTFFRFHYREMVGQTEPIFNNDIGFYLFRLPFIQLVQNSLSVLAFIGTISLVLGYVYSGQFGYKPGQGVRTSTFTTRHLSINLAFWLLTLAWGFYLDRYNLLYDDKGVVVGAGYTDVHVVIPILWILTILMAALAILVALQWYYPRIRLVFWSGVGFVIILVLGLNILPPVIQNFIVEPNELQLETPYIKNNIKLTRNAYDLDKIEERNYNADDTLDYQEFRANATTLENIRLWDPRMLIKAYRQLQEIRSYYQFYSVSVDRYHTNSGYRQMMLSGRELAENLPDKANTWVNKHLQYTHGYGLVMNPVTQEGTKGIPTLTIKDIPPVSTNGLEVTQPAIYYGKHQSGYRIVNTGIKELDYPKGDENVYTNYQGKGGIPINSYFRKLLFAWEQGDFNILLSGYINDNSRIQLWRPVQQRIQKVAPFLKLDDDPYLVLNNGKLYWIQDAYTTSSDYPYSDSYHGQFNYLRNSVKAVVNAYDGTVSFYVVNPDDPVLQVYRDLFPDLFHSLSDMPDGLRQHLRYPKTLFEVQMDKYNKYHMQDPQVFYNNEDLWTRPNEKYSGTSILMEPYYILSKLPGETQEQYMLISPLTPNNRDNMIAWIAAKSDFPDYGHMIVYKLPKERLIYGPTQIEARIDQDPEISRQLSLWDQRGSKVIRGNLMVIPVENTFLYVEPVFLIAEGVDIPQLQRVIVAYQDKIAMEPNLDTALRVIFGKKAQEPVVQAPAAPETGQQPRTGKLVEMDRIQNAWQQARQAMQQGDWTKLGQAMDQLGQLLNSNNNGSKPQTDK